MKFILLSLIILILKCNEKIASGNSYENQQLPKVEKTEKLDKLIINQQNSISKSKSSDDSAIAVVNEVVVNAKEVIEFEEVNHYFYSLTSEDHLLINNQAKMDAVYSTIHNQNKGKRLAPIPTIMEDTTYLIFKPVLKTSNDIEIKEIYLQNGILYVQVEPFLNPEMKSNSRVSPHVLVKLLRKINTKKVIIKYK